MIKTHIIKIPIHLQRKKIEFKLTKHEYYLNEHKFIHNFDLAANYYNYAILNESILIFEFFKDSIIKSNNE